MAEALAGVLRGLGLEARLREATVAKIWGEVVGFQIARRAQPESLRGGRLTVRVSDPIWLHHLHMMQPKLLAALNERTEPGRIREIHLRVGEIDPPSDAPAAPAGPPPAASPSVSPEDEERIVALLAPVREASWAEALGRILGRELRR